MSMLLKYLQNFSLWEAVGWCGQILFFTRFLAQWVASERARKSVVPFHFWTISIAGSVLLLAYLIHEFSAKSAGLPLLAGQCIGLLVYSRNIMLLKRKELA